MYREYLCRKCGCECTLKANNIATIEPFVCSTSKTYIPEWNLVEDIK